MELGFSPAERGSLMERDRCRGTENIKQADRAWGDVSQGFRRRKTDTGHFPTPLEDLKSKACLTDGVAKQALAIIRRHPAV